MANILQIDQKSFLNNKFFIKLYIQVGISMIMMSHSLIMTLNLQRIKKTYVRET